MAEGVSAGSAMRSFRFVSFRFVSGCVLSMSCGAWELEAMCSLAFGSMGCRQVYILQATGSWRVRQCVCRQVQHSWRAQSCGTFFVCVCVGGGGGVFFFFLCVVCVRGWLGGCYVSNAWHVLRTRTALPRPKATTACQKSH